MARQRIKKNKIGYYELVDKPTAKQLENFYKNQYFDSNNFEVKYSDEELFHKTISFIEASMPIRKYSRIKGTCWYLIQKASFSNTWKQEAADNRSRSLGVLLF